MGNGCDPELRLWLGSEQYSSAAEDSDSTRSSSVTNWIGNASQLQQFQQQPRQQQQQITIFYNGRICVCDVTEIQARAIICMAKREMEERSLGENYKSSSQSQPSSSPTAPLAPQLINPRLSMKRSLQRFLQKRKTRMDAASPYNNIHCTSEWER